MSVRGGVIWLMAVLVVAALVLLAPRAETPDATLAVRRYLTHTALDVADREAPPTSGTLIVLNDLRDIAEAQPLLRWTERGGRLVVADPRSVILGLVGAFPAGPVGFVGPTELEPGCLAPEVVGVRRVVARASDVALQAVHEGFVSCFPAGDGAFLLTRRYGEGTVTLLGGLSPLTNEMLTEGDNALFAAQLARPGPAVVFAPPLPAASAPVEGGPWEFLPDRARVIVAAVILAEVAFALVRARRLGRPVLEEPVAPIPASELVRATARMYRRARTAAYCGKILRDATAARFARRVGAFGRGEELARILARTSGVPEERVEEILGGPDSRTDDDLIHLGRELEELTARARSGAP